MVTELATYQMTPIFLGVGNNDGIGLIQIVEAKVENLNLKEIKHQHQSVLQSWVGADLLHHSRAAVESRGMDRRSKRQAGLRTLSVPHSPCGVGTCIRLPAGRIVKAVICSNNETA